MIELYTGKGCAACVTLKNRLLDLGISGYEPRSTDMLEHRDYIMGLGFRSIPVMVKKDDQGNILGSMQGALMCDEVLEGFFKSEVPITEETSSEKSWRLTKRSRSMQ